MAARTGVAPFGRDGAAAVDEAATASAHAHAGIIKERLDCTSASPRRLNQMLHCSSLFVRRALVERRAMLTELDIEQIERDLRAGVHGPRLAMWVEKLLQDREERIHHEREVAVQLLATAPSHLPVPAHPGPHAHPHPHPHHPRTIVRA
jgi:hypothetical protein